MLEKLKQSVWEANIALPKNGLVKWTSGNASGRDPNTNYVVIKPSGCTFEELRPQDLVVVDMDGKIIEGNLKPSVDTTSHLYVYKHRPDIHGIVHTHSAYATSFAIRGEPIKIYTTTSAAVFGSDIPVSDFVVIGNEEIGREIVERIGDGVAVLIRNHGVFTIGDDVFAALKYSVILEETAESVHFAMLRGDIIPLSETVVRKGYEIYHSTYGQKNRMIWCNHD